MAEGISISLTLPTVSPSDQVDPSMRGAHMWSKANGKKVQHMLNEWMPVSQETHTLAKSTQVVYTRGGSLNVPTVVRTQAFQPRAPQAQSPRMGIVEVTEADSDTVVVHRS